MTMRRSFVLKDASTCLVETTTGQSALRVLNNVRAGRLTKALRLKKLQVIFHSRCAIIRML